MEPTGCKIFFASNPEDKTAIMSITQTVLDNKTDLGIIFVSQFAVAIPYQFPKHAMSIYANKHTSIDKPRQCTLGKASGTSDGAASSEQRAAAVVDPNLSGVG